MKSFLTALVLSAASVLPATASIHDFTPSNSAPTRARAGQGQCVTTRDRSRICYIKTSSSDYSVAIRDIDYPGIIEAAHINCSTGRWSAFGGLPKGTLEAYFGEFCKHF